MGRSATPSFVRPSSGRVVVGRHELTQPTARCRLTWNKDGSHDPTNVHEGGRSEPHGHPGEVRRSRDDRRTGVGSPDSKRVGETEGKDEV